MKKKRIFMLCLIVFFILLIAGIIAIPKKKKLQIDSNNIVCIQIKKSNKTVNIIKRDEIDKIVNILNSIQYKKKHPYIRVIDILTGKDKEPVNKNVFQIALFDEEQDYYFFKDGYQKIIIDRNINSSYSAMRINSKDYEFLNMDEVVYKEYFRDLVEKYYEE